MRILVLEDNPDDFLLIQKRLREVPGTEFELEHVTYLKDAKERLTKGEFDLVLTDLNVPDSQGIETVLQLVKEAPEVPVVALTGVDVGEQMGLETVRKGAQDYLAKQDLDGKTLVRVIRYAIERKQTERKLKEGTQVKSEFISMVSHELRTPLTVIKEGVALVQDGSLGALNPDQQKYLGLAKKNIDRLARLINGVLDFQRLESGQTAIHMAENDMNELVNEVKESFALAAKTQALDLSTELENGLSRILFDRDTILQVLTNFMGNALKVMEKGKITLKTKRFGNNAVRVSVEDEGPGIREEDIPKLFKVFSQLNVRNERKPGSSGLGLAISKKIIDMHNGKIGVESVYGKGSTFYFLLPIKERRNR